MPDGSVSGRGVTSGGRDAFERSRPLGRGRRDALDLSSRSTASWGMRGESVRCLFVYFAPIYEYGGMHFSRHYTSAFWRDRYVDHFGEVVVATRLIRADEATVHGMERSDTDGLAFHGINGYQGETSVWIRRSLVAQDLQRLIANADCVVVRLPSLLGNLAIDECRRQAKPYLVEVVGCAWDSLVNHSVRGALVAPYAWRAMRRRVRTASHVAYVTDRFLQQRYPTLGSAIGGSDAMIGAADESVLKTRIDRIARDSRPLMIGTIGSLDVRYKGQALLIRALAVLRERGRDDFRYQMVGDGDGTRLRRIAAECGVGDAVEFLGPMSHSSINSWFDSIDVYAQPSLTEGLPRSLVEAMSRGLPALGTRVGGIPELLSDDCTVSPRNNPSEAMSRILGSYDKCTLSEQAMRNFEFSKCYRADHSRAVRGAFYAEFARVAGRGR